MSPGAILAAGHARWVLPDFDLNPKYSIFSAWVVIGSINLLVGTLFVQVLYP